MCCVRVFWQAFRLSFRWLPSTPVNRAHAPQPVPNLNACTRALMRSSDTSCITPTACAFLDVLGNAAVLRNMCGGHVPLRRPCSCRHVGPQGIRQSGPLQASPAATHGAPRHGDHTHAQAVRVCLSRCCTQTSWSIEPSQQHVLGERPPRRNGEHRSLPKSRCSWANPPQKPVGSGDTK